MKILIDMQCMQSGSSKGGIGRYSYSLLKAMIANNKSHEISILLNAKLPMPNYDKLAELIPQNRIYKFYTSGDTREFFKENYIRSELAKLSREYTVALINPDILFIMSLFEGLYERTITSLGEIFPANKTVVILYDLIPLVEKEKYLTSHIVDKHYMSKIFFLIQSGLLLSISKFSKNEAMNVLKIPDKQIVNISSAIDEKFKKIQISELTKSKLYKKYGINDKFLMFTGSYDLRKNQENLIRSFALLEEKIRKNYQLLIIGTGSPSVLDRLKNITKELGFNRNEVIFLGYIDDEELLNFYNLTSLFVFPPLREGFGLPALEAMSCGVPTIGSNTTSIPEVINKADALFSPNDINCISSRIKQVLEDDNFAQELIEHGLLQAKNFSWDKSAIKTLEAIEDQYEKVKNDSFYSYKNIYDTLVHKISIIENIREIDKNELIKASNCLAENKKENKKNIGIISTWNTRCGIASYTSYLINTFLDKTIILAPYIDESELIKKDESNVLRVWSMRSDDFEKLLQQIKDEELDTIFIQFNYGFFEFTNFKKLIEKLIELDIKVNITFHSTSDDLTKKDKSLKILADSLKKCKQIFVHTTQDVQNLNKLEIRHNVILLNQGVIDITHPRKTKNINEKFQISTYGFFLKPKGLINIIKAFKILIDKGYNLSLLMLNAKYSDAASNDLIKTANELILTYKLENHVELNTNYLSDEESILQLSRTDLVVYPYTNTGESSSAAIRMAIAARTNIAVTPQSIFDEVKDFSFVFDGDGIDDLVVGLSDAIEQIKENNEAVKKMKIKRENFRKKHLYSKISKKIKKILFR